MWQLESQRLYLFQQRLVLGGEGGLGGRNLALRDVDLRLDVIQLLGGCCIGFNQVAHTLLLLVEGGELVVQHPHLGGGVRATRQGCFN